MSEYHAVVSQRDYEDPLWLEDVNSEIALKWVAEQNIKTQGELCLGDGFHRVEESILKEISSDSRIPWISKYGGYVYNFWQDGDFPAGVWRRTTLDDYRSSCPAWETVLDLAELRLREGVSWVFNGVSVLPPEYRYCLIRLSPGGSDACEVREFDLLQKCFVEGGFKLPVSKSSVSWIDKDSLYLADASGEGTVTVSGYPRVIKRWLRGTTASQAKIIFQGEFGDVGVHAYRDHAPDCKRDFIIRNLDAHHSEAFLLSAEDELARINIPTDAQFSVFHDWLLVMPVRDWSIGSKEYAPGQLLAAPLEEFLAGDINFTVLYSPTPRSALQGFHRVGKHLALNVMESVVSRIEILHFQDGDWTRSRMDSPNPLSTLAIGALDLDSDKFLLTVSGFLQPSALYLGDLAKGSSTELLKSVSDLQDFTRYRVSQHFACSADGTKIPYFEISASNVQLDGQNPTLLYGYGGFQVSLQPSYLGINIPAWLERGGVYVIANIRGGGEFGPTWHQAALRHNRPRAYEDFAAVAQALVSRKLTIPAKLGIRGGSNGGLLVGNMLTHYPHLFGGIVCEVPLLDMYRYPLLLAGASWIAEYGDPSCEEEWDYIRLFSPYHNIRADQAYPPTLFLTSASDDRVSPSHARKMVYRMHQAGYANSYFYESSSGGHGGAGEHKKVAHREAMISEFLWKRLA